MLVGFVSDEFYAALPDVLLEFRDPDGHRLEIYWGLDQVGSDGQVRPPSEWKWAHTLEEAVRDPVRGQDTTLADSTLKP